MLVLFLIMVHCTKSQKTLYADPAQHEPFPADLSRFENGWSVLLNSIQRTSSLLTGHYLNLILI